MFFASHTNDVVVRVHQVCKNVFDVMNRISLGGNLEAKGFDRRQSFGTSLSLVAGGVNIATLVILWIDLSR